MGFTKLTPTSRGAVQHPVISARVSIGARNWRRLILGFNLAAIETHAGGCDHLDVLRGEDEDLGDLLLQFGPDGSFGLGGDARRGRRISLAWFRGLPEHSTTKEACEIEVSGAGVLVRLPLAAWRPAETRAAPKVAPVGLVAPPSPPLRARGEDPAPLDMVEYLKGKGVQARRVAGGRITIDGEVKPSLYVLRTVNAWREEERLPALEPEDVR